MKKVLAAFAAASCLLLSCIKQEPGSMECDILAAEVDASFAPYFYKTTQMIVPDIASNESEIVFIVRSLLSLPKSVPVTFQLTPGATISPENGSAQDFTAGPVTYTVTSEDGAWQRQYAVSFREATLPMSQLSFEHFEAVVSQYDANTSYHEFYEPGAGGERRNIWASGNPGVAIVNDGWKPEQFPTYATPDGYSGYGVCLNTQYAGALGALFGKPIAAGNLFLGRFIVENVLLDALKATDFGIPTDRVPLRVKGWYKYTPGPEFKDKEQHIVEGRIDEANIYGVFYRNTDEEGNPVKLDGTNVLTSPYIVRKAQVASLPATDSWSQFEMFFEGEKTDPEVLEALGYSFTIVFSSSKDGDRFEGAIGSTLYVDEVEVIYEED